MESLKPYRNIWYLNLDKNRLTQIPNLGLVPKLVQLDINDNQINEIDSTITTMRVLTVVNIQRYVEGST